MTTTADKLRALGIETLSENHGDITKASAKLARTLIEDAKRPLLIELMSFYLTRIDAKSSRFKPHGRRREGPHRRIATLGTPSAQQKAGVIKAGKVIRDTIFERRIRGSGRLGDIHVHELRAIAESQARTATSFLQRGFDDAVEAIWCSMLNDHCVAADPFTKVRDAISATVAEEMHQQAGIKAAEVIRDGSAKVASDIIASARKPLQADARS